MIAFIAVSSLILVLTVIAYLISERETRARLDKMILTEFSRWMNDRKSIRETSEDNARKINILYNRMMTNRRKIEELDIRVVQTQNRCQIKNLNLKYANRKINK